MKMIIADLRILDDRIKTDEGTVKAPTAFFMDIEDENKDRFTIPIDQGAFMALTNLYADRRALDPVESADVE